MLKPIEFPMDSCRAGQTLRSLLKLSRLSSQFYHSKGDATFGDIVDTIHAAFMVSDFDGKTPILWKNCEWKTVSPKYFADRWAIASVYLTKLDGAFMQELVTKPTRRLRAIRESPDTFQQLKNNRERVPELWKVLQESIIVPEIQAEHTEMAEISLQHALNKTHPYMVPPRMPTRGPLHNDDDEKAEPQKKKKKRQPSKPRKIQKKYKTDPDTK